MVGIAQLVRAPGCGPGGRGFESHYSPHKFKYTLFGVSPSGKARDFDSRIRRFKSCHPSQQDRVDPDDGVSPSGKAWDSDSHIRGFESFHPSQQTLALLKLEKQFNPRIPPNRSTIMKWGERNRPKRSSFC